MTRTFILAGTFLIIIFFVGCGTSSPILATIGDEKITLNNFEDDYAKNNGGWDSSAVSSLEDKQRFLDLLVKFKLKVKEARTQGLEKDTAIINEVESYDNSVAQSFMIEKEVIEPGMQQMYDKKKDEVRASHILFRLKPSAAPEDTLMAYFHAMSVIEQIPTVPFDSLASRYSEDQSVKSNYGDLGFFTAGKMVPEFEDACYSIKIGAYTKIPVRSQFGYHVIKVTDRQPNSGTIRLSHILLRFKEGSKDTAAVRDSIWMIYQKLKSGANFSEIVKKYSQDPKSAALNGDMGFYERGRVPPKIADILFKLNVDSIAEPMRFNYGYQIFKIAEKKGLPSFAEMQKDLRESYKQLRYPYEYKLYTQGLKAKYHVIIDSSAVQN